MTWFYLEKSELNCWYLLFIMSKRLEQSSIQSFRWSLHIHHDFFSHINNIAIDNTKITLERDEQHGVYHKETDRKCKGGTLFQCYMEKRGRNVEGKLYTYPHRVSIYWLAENATLHWQNNMLRPIEATCEKYSHRLNVIPISFYKETSFKKEILKKSAETGK